MDEDRSFGEPAPQMIEHLARRLVNRYGPDAPAEADQIVRLLKSDGNDEQAEVWAKVGAVCRRMTEKRGTPARKD